VSWLTSSPVVNATDSEATRPACVGPIVLVAARSGLVGVFSALGPRPMLAHYGSRLVRLGGSHGRASERQTGPTRHAFATGDLDGLKESMAHDVVWHEPGRGPFAGDHKGPEGVLALLEELRARSNGTFAVEIVDATLPDNDPLCAPHNPGARVSPIAGSAALSRCPGAALR
jgi:hypothetical protein